jgi:hypothetical protein
MIDTPSMIHTPLTAFVGAVAGLVGVGLFQHFLGGWSFRPLFWVGTILGVVGGTFDLIIISRVNIALGIPDKLFYVSGNAVLRPILLAATHMPAIVLTSKLVPKGLESTTYALLAGFQNFGSVVSSQVGVYVIKTVGIKTSEDDGCDFEMLPATIAFAHCLLPLLAIPLTFVLIPDKRMTVRTRMRAHARTHARTHTHTHARTHARAHARTHKREREKNGYTHAHS